MSGFTENEIRQLEEGGYSPDSIGGMYDAMADYRNVSGQSMEECIHDMTKMLSCFNTPFGLEDPEEIERVTNILSK